MKRLHLHVFGWVQGVGYRYSCCREARALGVTGWVRNLPDDSVEIVAEGSSDALDLFSAWCSHGPPHAKVDRVVSTTSPARGEFSSFNIRAGWDEQP